MAFSRCARAAYREETTSLALAARVFTMSGAKEVKVASTDDITDSDLSFKAGTSGVHYIRTWVKEGKGLDYPDYLMYAMVDVGTNDVGFLSVDVAGAPGTWTYNKGSYPSGATIATAPADNAVVSFAANVQILEPMGADFSDDAPTVVKSLLRAAVSKSGNTPVEDSSEVQLYIQSLSLLSFTVSMILFP